MSKNYKKILRAKTYRYQIDNEKKIVVRSLINKLYPFMEIPLIHKNLSQKYLNIIYVVMKASPSLWN